MSTSARMTEPPRLLMRMPSLSRCANRRHSPYIRGWRRRLAVSNRRCAICLVSLPRGTTAPRPRWASVVILARHPEATALCRLACIAGATLPFGISAAGFRPFLMQPPPGHPASATRSDADVRDGWRERRCTTDAGLVPKVQVNNVLYAHGPIKGSPAIGRGGRGFSHPTRLLDLGHVFSLGGISAYGQTPPDCGGCAGALCWIISSRRGQSGLHGHTSGHGGQRIRAEQKTHNAGSVGARTNAGPSRRGAAISSGVSLSETEYKLV